jgi:hypothetical protein
MLGGTPDGAETHQLRKNIFPFVHRNSLLSNEVYNPESISNRSHPKAFLKN